MERDPVDDARRSITDLDLRALRVPAALFTGSCWAISLAYGILTKDFVPLGLTTPVIVIAASAIFAIKNGNGNGGK